MAWRRADHASASASATNSGGESSSARTPAPRPIAASPATASSREQSPASATALASVFRRCENAASTRRFTLCGRGRRDPTEGDERRVDVRPRPEHLARDRVEAGALGGELNEDRDRSVRLRRRVGEEAVGDLALHHHAPGAELVEREALDDDAGSRCCRAGSRRASSAAARMSTGRARARLPSGRVFAGSLRARARGAGRSRPRERRSTRSARKRVSTPSPGPTSSTTSAGSSAASRPITPRMFSSMRKCCPSAFRGRTLTARRRRRRSRRSAPRARRARHRGPRPVRRTCG